MGCDPFADRACRADEDGGVDYRASGRGSIGEISKGSACRAPSSQWSVLENHDGAPRTPAPEHSFTLCAIPEAVSSTESIHYSPAGRPLTMSCHCDGTRE